MCAKIAKTVLLSISLMAFGTVMSFAQAVFSVGSTPSTAADIGQTELAGTISFTVVSGTTVTSPIQIVYPAQITNTADADISISGTGGLSGILAAPTLDRAQNTITINVPNGGEVGDTIYVRNVRLATAGLESGQLEATIHSPSPTGNSIIAGQINPIVISAIAEPFSVDQSAAPLSFSGGTVTNSTTSFLISEAYPTAFTSTLGVGGQTVPTRFRITPFPSVPQGVHLTFDETAVSPETGAIFRTLSGAAETVPRADGSTDVTYEFSAAGSSPSTAESFEFNAAVTVDAVESGIIRFQAVLVPIGLAVPAEEFPSTDIPRYVERLVPDEADLVTGSTELVFPFPMRIDDAYTGIALTNPMNYRVRATLTAYDSEGALIIGDDITNPVTIILPRKGQFAKLASELFGPDFNAYSPGTICVIGQTSQLGGFYLTGDIAGPKLDGGTGNITSSRIWYLPVVFHQGDSPFNSLEFYNPGTSGTVVRLQLMDPDGKQVDTAEETVAAGGTLSSDISQIFGIDLDSFDGRYIKGNSDLPLIVRSTFGNALESNVLAAQRPSSPGSFFIPHFASGGQYSTELTIVNTNTYYEANITLTPLDNSGTRISDPVNVKIEPGAQLIRTVAELYPNLGNDLSTGSIRVELEPSHRGPFIIYPSLVGAVRFANADGSASASLPLVIPRANGFFYSHVAQDQDWFTGITIMNSAATPANLTLDVYLDDGVPVGTYSSQLQPGERLASLVSELVPASEGQSGGYVQISSDAYLTSFALFGSTDLRSLSAIPPQSIK